MLKSDMAPSGSINFSLDNVMEGWRLKRLPRIDQDILRQILKEIREHPNNRENITFHGW